ncbi:MAG: DUF3604 domain-containing protein [Burkholderiaceae bacterium]
MNERSLAPSPVDTAQVGAVWPQAHPGTDPVLYGHVRLDPQGGFEVRSSQTFTLTYTVGRYGIDDTGAIRVVFRFFGDWGALQTNDPRGHGYVSAHTSGASRISLSFEKTGHQRPFFQALTARVHGGFLREGDTITIIFGDPAGGSPGMKLQTFCESAFEFKVLADVCAVGHYVPLPETPVISVVPGAPVHWRAILPTLRRPGEGFQLGLKCEDAWGNPSDKVNAVLRLEPSVPVKGLPEHVRFEPGQRAITLEHLSIDAPTCLRIALWLGDERVAEAGPLVIRDSAYGGYWADMHGQSGESIGVSTALEYFTFARDMAFLDASSHQANDFQVNNAFWSHLNRLTAQFHEDHRFVTLPGYEWSGNTSVGGDRNIFFRHEGRQIRRSSHALLVDRSDIDTDATDARQLFTALADEDCVAYAHVGGRYADTAYAHDGRIEKSMEIHSAWGTFEWLLTDGFALGHRCGVVCNSDGHKGRPGASYPGAATFGAYGGLTCFLAPELTRDGLFDSLRRRHHYGTTGCRLHLDVRVAFDAPAQCYDEDPAIYPDTGRRMVDQAMMGDIVHYDGERCRLSLEVAAGAPIERIEVRNGTDVIRTLRPYGEGELGSRIRVVWSGAEYRGRGRQSDWRGRAHFRGARIRRMARINAWNLERRLEQSSADTIEWDAITTGNFGGFDVWLDEQPGAMLDLACNHGALQEALASIGLEDRVLEAGGLARRLKVFRLPEDHGVREMRASVDIPLAAGQDNPLWVSVITEDGFQAWSSPVFVFGR